MLKISSSVAEPDYRNATCGGRVVRLGGGVHTSAKSQCLRGQRRAEVLSEVLTDDEDFGEYFDEYRSDAPRHVASRTPPRQAECRGRQRWPCSVGTMASTLVSRTSHLRLWTALIAMLATLLVGGFLGAANAAADGDPASDVLLGENVFYPYSPPVSASLQRDLNRVAAAAKRAGFPIKVALIASPVDLGVVPDLFQKPQQYAKFLDQEISFNAKLPVLVVMPAGVSGAGFSSPVMTALAAVRPPAGAKPNDLAQTAIQTIPKLAAAAGHPFKANAGSSSGGSSNGSGSTGVLVFLVPLALLVAVALVVSLRGRRPKPTD